MNRNISLLTAVVTGLVLLAACGSDGPSRARAEEPGPDTLILSSPLIAPPVERLAELFPDGIEFREQSDPFPYLAVHDQNDALLGYMTSTDFAGTTAEGFGGPVPIRVFLDPEGATVDFDVLDNFETPAYMKLLLCSDFKARVIAYRAGQEEEIDAITLATVSSAAIITGVTGVIDRFATEILASEQQ